MDSLVIENYGIAEHSDLLFKGTIYKNDSRQTNSLATLNGFNSIQLPSKNMRASVPTLNLLITGWICTG